MGEETSTDGSARRDWERLRRAAPFLEVFEVMGTKFCFCTVTCFFCAIDDAVAAAIESLAAGTTFDDTELRFRADPSYPALDEVVAELSSLLESGYLSSDDPLAQAPPDGPASVTALALIMATSCNLRCRYCYADAGSYHRPQRLMDVATAKCAVDFLLRNSHRAKDVAISFFGGEPLLDYRCIEEVVPYACDRFERTGQSCSFSVTTNGTLLTPERVAFFEKHGFAYIVSLDGPADVNDRNRIFPDGSGSYQQVIARLTQLEEKFPGFREKITIRATFTGQDHALVSCLAHLRQLGFRQIALESCSALPEQLGIANEGVPGILREYDAAARWYLEQLEAGDRFIFSHMHQLFFQVAEGTKRITQCGAGRGYLAVLSRGHPEGEVALGDVGIHR